MDITQHDLRYWPPEGGGTASALEAGTTKIAQLPDLSVRAVVDRFVGGLRTWGRDMPAVVKTAALRAGGQEAPEVTPQNIWRHPNASPAALTLLLLDRYGEEYVEWDPQVLRTTLEREGTSMSNSVWTKILAARCALGSPSPWKQWEVFHYTCLGLSGDSPNFVFMEEPEIGHLLAGMEFMDLIDPEREPQEEIDKFVAAAFKLDGIIYIPPPLDFAQAELENQQLRCLNCQALMRDDNDQRCVTCGSPQLVRVPYEYEAEKQKLKSLFNTRKSMPLEQALDGLPEDGTGNAVYHLLVHWDYLNQVRTQMAQQLHMLGKS